MRAVVAWLLLVLLSAEAPAYLPPAHLLAKRIAESHDPAKLVLAKVGVYRAGETASDADSLLWEEHALIPLQGTPRSPERWPGLSILLESDPARLMEGLRRFGLAVVPETALLRHPLEKVRAMKDPPRPFYLPDPSMSFQRVGKRMAWVSTSADGARSLWVEKDSFFPIKLQGPCPASVEEISWANSSDLPCELLYESVTGLQNARGGKVSLLVRRNGQNLIRFRINRVFLNPAPELATEARAKDKEEKAERLFTSVFLN
ncbi:MAG: hypothetical protein HUU37_04845 [Bdellovibrionales bacterium]|nr:hypothetical protein [Bdellovibrionales bacterium]